MARPYFVKEGRALLTSVGIKGPGEEVTPKMLTGGEDAFKTLLESKKNPLSTSKPANKADVKAYEAPKDGNKKNENNKDENNKDDKDAGAQKN